MADKTIGDLTQAESIGGEDLFVLQQNGEAKKLKGARLVKYAQDTVGEQVTAATEAAESAETAKTGAESAQTQAQAARDAILNMLVEAITLEQGSPATVERSLVDSVYKLTFGIPSGKKGDPGATGPANTLTIGTVTSGIEASASITGEAPNQVLNLVLKQGDKGNPGDDAPTITGITIRQSDYHMIVTLSDGTSYDAGYCRGASGAGTGDMLASTYDPQGKAQDIFAYVDNAISGVTVTTDATPTQGSTNPVQSGGVYTALANKLDKTGDGSNVTATFTAASSRTNIATGEKLGVLFGKITKWLADLGSLAFKSTVAKSDLASDVQTSLGKADSALQSVSKSDVGLGNVANERQYSSANPPPYPVTSVNGKTGAVTVSVPTIPDTTSLIKGDGSGGLTAATAGTDYAMVPTTRKVTLTASGWNSSTKQQTVTCSGVLSDATKQLLIPTPVNTAAGNPYDEASIQMVAQGENSVTFYADTVPTVGIDVYVTIYPINYLG